MRRLWWRVYLALGVCAVAGYLFVPAGIPRDAVYFAVGTSEAVAVLMGLRINAPQRHLPWRLMVVGQVFWVLGDSLSSWFDDVEHVDNAYSMADVFYLSGYAVIAAALVLMIYGRLPGRDVPGSLDSTILTAGLALLSWVLLARPTLDGSSSGLAATVALAYPVADIVLVGLLIRLVTTPGGRTTSFRLLLGALTLLVVADTGYSALGLWSSFDPSLFEPLWLASYFTWGAAALHPSMAELSAPYSGMVQFSRGRLAAMTVASLVAPATLAGEYLAGAVLDVWAIVTGSALLFSLVVARMSLVIRQMAASNADRERLQQSLAYQAAHDALTDLPNRAEALHEIQAALNRARRTGALLGLLFIDLDGFKNVNDSSGHAVGDEVLRVVARRLLAGVRAGDMVARLGGDEFVVLLETLTDEVEAVQIAERLIGAIAEPVDLSGPRQACVGASVGMAISQDGSIDAQRLLHEADTAVYRAKAAGRGRVEVFDDALRLELAERAELERALVTAISDDQLVLHYQPIVDLSLDTVRGYEVLVRWNRPGHGMIAPDNFIPLAETSDLICDLDRWVLDHATEQMAAWARSGMPRRTLAVNISGRHISDPRIVHEVAAALARSGLDPGQLILEITETVLIEDLLAVPHLRALRELGVAISIDDFGTGYNSIIRLQHLPIDIVKIDRSFLDDSQPTSAALVQMVVDTAHAFGLPVVAEGVETPEQLALLRRLACDSAQGYLLARPSGAEQIAHADESARRATARLLTPLAGDNEVA